METVYTMDQTIKIEKATEVQIGQPAVYPFEIVNLLIPLNKRISSQSGICRGFTIRIPKSLRIIYLVLMLMAMSKT